MWSRKSGVQDARDNWGVQDALSENCGVPKTFRNPNFGDRNYSQNDSPETELAAVGREFLSKNPINN